MRGIKFFFFIFLFSNFLFSENVIDYVRFFSSLKSRVPGYEGHKKALNFIEKKFKQAGLKNIKKEKFTVAVPVEKEAYLEYNGKRIKLHCLWPNLVRTPTTPPEGIEGILIYGKDGDLRNFEGKDLKKSIVVLDFNSGSRWTTLSMLGVKAFIFLESDDISREEAERKFLSVPLNVPRFYATKENIPQILKLARSESKVKIYGRMDWENVTDYNIYGFMEGRDENLKKEIIIIESFYDSISVVPSIAPGADGSCGISVLLDILDYFKKHPPKRSIIFLATSSHYQSLKGIDKFVNRHLRNMEPFKSRIKKERIEPKLFIGLDLTSESDEIVIWHNSYEFYLQKVFAPLAKKFIAYSERFYRRIGYPYQPLLNGISPKKGLTWSSFHMNPIRTDGEIVILSGVPAISFITANEGRWRIDTPIDKFENLNIKNIERQSIFLKKLLKKAIDDPDLFANTQLKVEDKLAYLEVRIVTFDPRKSFVPNKPVKGALAFIRRDKICPSLSYSKTHCGVREDLIEITDENGIAKFTQFYVETLWWLQPQMWVQAFYINPENGEIILAPDLGVNGDQQFPLHLTIDYKEKKWMAVLFDCKAINLFGLIDPQYLIPLNKVDIFDLSNSLPDAYGYYLQFPGDTLNLGWTSYSEPFGVIFVQPHSGIKVAGESGPLGKRLLLLNSKESLTNKEYVEGLGFSADEIDSIYDTPYQGAKDMIILDTFRRRNFEKYGVRNERLKMLQEKSIKLLKKAEECRKKKDWFGFLKFSRQAQAIESRAYPDVKNTANDVIKGLIFYFMLLLPFAYFCERLFFGFPKIQHRIIAVFGIFILIYLIMRFIHPGFKLTNAPEVILLSFIILALSIIVLSIITSKFEEQMQRLKRETSKVYQTDVGRVSAAAAAFSLGVANMKRRKIRTLLTSITLILLTFTVLSFTSIKSYMKFTKVLRPNPPYYQGILLRDRCWFPLQEVALSYVIDEFSSKGTIVPRAWYIPSELGHMGGIQVKRKDKRFWVSGLIGLYPEETSVTHIDRTLIAGKWFEKIDENTCIISQKIAEFLNIRKEDVGKVYVEVFGKKFLVKGIFDSKRLMEIKDLDNEPLTPVDFSSFSESERTRMSIQRSAQVYQRKVIIPAFIHRDAENIILFPYKKVMEMSGTLQSIAVKFKEGVDSKSLVEDFILKLAGIVFAGIGEKTYVYSSIGLTAVSGLSNLIIPILIAALIVLNTMLGSVYERIKEIGTYSAVGLAPVHIASLFLAESMVYAVLGAVAGYLIGQILAKIMVVTGMLKGLILNYSSLSAVFATIIIVFTVLLSTLYPARKASQMSVPDVTRRWVLPKPKGDRWEFEFPFTVSEFEVLGLATFLTDYFNSYQDISVGDFYTNGATLRYEKIDGNKNKYYITTEVWIAPFDLGVSQKMEIIMEPLGEYNFYTINLILTRMSGEAGDWERLNRKFLDGIRKQFLIWRTVSTEIKKDYENQGKAILKLA